MMCVVGSGWPLFVEAGVSSGEERAFIAADGHGHVPADRRRGIDPPVGGWRPRRWPWPSPAITSCSTQAIVGHGGVRPVEQGEGDSVVGAFSRASDAVAAAVAAQRAFAAELWPEGADLRVRMAVHTGEAQLRDEGYYLGHALNRCGPDPRDRTRRTGAGLRGDRGAGRRSSPGRGRRWLISASTVSRTSERPEHIWQLVHPDLPSAFPPLRSLDAFHHNLPIQLTPLIGRESEIIDVRDAAGGRAVGDADRFGRGGQDPPRPRRRRGGTRLAARRRVVGGAGAARRSGRRRSRRARRPGAREGPGAPSSDQLAVELGDQPSLLVLDNCEHLVAACAELVTALLSANPSTSVLTTSREPLGVPGEITWRVPSMRCPSLDGGRRRPGAVAVRRGRPVRRAGPPGPTVLRGQRRQRARHRPDLPPPRRHPARPRAGRRPLPAAVGRAHRRRARRPVPAADRRSPHGHGPPADPGRLGRLEPRPTRRRPNRSPFRRLGVFAGRFPLEAAEAVVAAAGDVDPAEVFDLVSRLVDKSLVAVDEGRRGEPRYRLLETLRAYALDRARTAGELTIVRDAHAAWWADWLEPRGAMPTDDILEEIEEFHANLTAALDWSTDRSAAGPPPPSRRGRSLGRPRGGR